MKPNIGKWEWVDYPILGSTNDEAKLLSNDIENRRIVITAEIQTKGRGRLGRNWISQKGNLFMSQLFKPQIKISDLVFITSLCVAEAIVNFTPDLKVNIKWPNDILINGKKFCGILIESENDAVIIGIGVNLINSPTDHEVIYPVTNLNDEGCQLSRQKFIESYLRLFDYYIELYRNKGFEIIRQKWLQYAYKLNNQIGIKNNREEKVGIYKGIDENGFLLLEQNNKIIKISVGDVFI